MKKAPECAETCQQARDFDTPGYRCAVECAYLARPIEFRLMMTIDGREVSSSCVKIGTKKQCETSASRLMRQKDKDQRTGWVVRPRVA